MTEVAAPGLTVRVESFVGPLDLLLHLCRTSEVDLARLPIRTVTDQYLAYIHGLEEAHADEISIFVVMAARLLQIKSEALLPRAPTRGPGEEDIAQSLIDHGRRIGTWPHFTSADTMVITVVCLARERTPIFSSARLDQRSVKFFDLRTPHQLVNELHRLDHRFQIFGMLQHARVDAHLIVRIRALQKNPTAISLFEQMSRDRHHAF